METIISEQFKQNLLLNIVLVNPEIPPNTGNIARLCAANHLALHLIHPLGFSLDEKQLRRAALDYWPLVQLTEYPSWSVFNEKNEQASKKCWYFSSNAHCSYWDVTFSKGDYLVFGPESHGLPKSWIEENVTRALLIEQAEPKVRSLNLSTAVGIATYEALRQLRTCA